MNLEREAFKAWLESKEPDDIVGFCGSVYKCPVAEYVRASTGAHYVKVAYDWATIKQRKFYPPRAKGFVPPKWASEFASTVDDEATSRGITARRALEILG